MQNTEAAPPLFSTWKALCYELLFVGLGYFVAGKKSLGIALGIVHHSCLAVCLLAYNPIIPNAVAGSCFILAFIIRIFSMIALFILLSKQDRTSPISRQWKCMFFTGLFPMLGFLVNRHWGKALLMLIMNMGIVIFLSITKLDSIPVLYQVCIIAMLTLDFYLAAIGLGLEPAITKRELQTFLCTFLVGYGILFVLYFDVYKKSVAGFYHIAGGSMRPTLVVDERILLMRNAAPYQRWDVVAYEIFREDLGEKRIQIGRLVGLPGEKIEFSKTGLLINDQPVVHDAAHPGFGYEWPTEGPMVDALRNSPREIWLTQTQVCILGDHSSTSMDSRVNGPSNLESILGKVTRVWWPPSAVRIVR